MPTSQRSNARRLLEPPPPAQASMIAARELVRQLLLSSLMRNVQLVGPCLMCLVLVGIAHAEDSVRKATDTEAASALDSVLENIVTGPALEHSRGASSGTKGSIEIRKSDGARPTIKGNLVVGTENTAGWHKRTIEWDFAKGTGTFESVRRDRDETELVSAIADTPEHKRQVFKTSGGPIERESIIDTRTVRLKAGGTAQVVKADERVVIAKRALVHFDSMGQASLYTKGGYVKTESADGGRVYTRSSIQVGGTTVSPEQLDAFMKNRVAL